MNIPWDLILRLLFEYLEDCDDDDDGKVDTIQNKPMAVRYAVSKSLRSAGYSGKKLRKARREVIAEIKETSTNELAAFVKNGAAGLASIDNN